MAHTFSAQQRTRYREILQQLLSTRILEHSEDSDRSEHSAQLHHPELDEVVGEIDHDQVGQRPSSVHNWMLRCLNSTLSIGTLEVQQQTLTVGTVIAVNSTLNNRLVTAETR